MTELGVAFLVSNVCWCLVALRLLRVLAERPGVEVVEDATTSAADEEPVEALPDAVSGDFQQWWQEQHAKWVADPYDDSIDPDFHHVQNGTQRGRELMRAAGADPDAAHSRR